MNNKAILERRKCLTRSKWNPNTFRLNCAWKQDALLSLGNLLIRKRIRCTANMRARLIVTLLYRQSVIIIHNYHHHHKIIKMVKSVVLETENKPTTLLLRRTTDRNNGTIFFPPHQNKFPFHYYTRQ